MSIKQGWLGQFEKCAFCCFESATSGPPVVMRV